MVVFDINTGGPIIIILIINLPNRESSSGAVIEEPSIPGLIF